MQEHGSTGLKIEIINERVEFVGEKGSIRWVSVSWVIVREVL